MRETDIVPPVGQSFPKSDAKNIDFFLEGEKAVAWKDNCRKGGGSEREGDLSFSKKAIL